MPSKCQFCRRKYILSGAYEKHLRTAHSNLDIVLASTVRDTLSMETSILYHREANELQDSDYESDPDPTGDELDALTAHQSDILEDAMSSLPGRQEHCRRAGEAIGDVDGFEQEHSKLCRDTWAPFSSAHGFQLASWFIQREVPKSGIHEYFSIGLGNSTLVGYSSMHTLENHLRSWTPTVRICNGSKDRLRIARELYHFSILTSWIVSDISCARSPTKMTWSTQCSVNSIIMMKGYMLKCTLQTGDGMSK